MIHSLQNFKYLFLFLWLDGQKQYEYEFPVSFQQAKTISGPETSDLYLVIPH